MSTSADIPDRRSVVIFADFLSSETSAFLRWMGNEYLSVGLKVALAAASGFCCWLVWWKNLFDAERAFAFYGLSGLLFAAGVLFPYLRRDRFFWHRCLGLIAISVLSYYSAINFGIGLGGWRGFGPAPEGFVTGSLVGAAIVLTGARLLIPLKHSVALVVTGLVAAIIGGFGFVLVADDRYYLSFMLWHSVMTLAIYSAETWPLPIGRT
jgi:hypothetical protein